MVPVVVTVKVLFCRVWDRHETDEKMYSLPLTEEVASDVKL